MRDLAIIVVSTDGTKSRPPFPTSVHAGAACALLDVIVAENVSTDATCKLVESTCPGARADL